MSLLHTKHNNCVVTFGNEYSVRCTCMYVQMFVSWYMYFDSWWVHWPQCFITRVWWI